MAATERMSVSVGIGNANRDVITITHRADDGLEATLSLPRDDALRLARSIDRVLHRGSIPEPVIGLRYRHFTDEQIDEIARQLGRRANRTMHHSV